MVIGTVVLLVVLGLTALVAALNWDLFTAPAALWLGVATVDAPLGLLLLATLALVTLVFGGLAIALQGRVIAETRRQARELKAQRDLADSAEASRFTELRSHMDAELKRVTQAGDAARDGVLARIDRLDTQVRLLIEQTGNTLSSYIGQLEDRIDGEKRPWPAGSRDVQPPPR